MTVTMPTLLLTFSLLICLPAYANSATDTNSAEIPEAIKALLDKAEAERESSPKQSLEHANKALHLALENRQPKTIAAVYNQIGQAESNLGNYASAQGAYSKALENWISLKDEAKQADALLNIGISSWRLGNYDEGLNYALKALRLHEKLRNETGVADSLHNIGIINDLLGNYDTALEYHHRALKMREKVQDKKGIASSLNNIGIVNYFKGKPEAALEYYMQSLTVQEEIGDKRGGAKTFNNVGMVYKELKNYKDALEYYLRAVDTWEEIDDQYQLANSLNNVGELYTMRKDYDKAKEYLDKGHQLAKEINAKESLRENYEFLSALEVARNDYKKALEYYKESTKLKDSIFSEESQKLVLDMQAKYDSEKKEQQITLLTKDNEINKLAIERQSLKQKALIGGLALFLVLGFVLYNRYRVSQRLNSKLRLANDQIKVEKEKSDQLLLNILPVRVANDLKETGRTEPESFENVTVYFSDIVGFTTASSGLEPKFLINELNTVFTAFDNIIERHQCERVKTIGDAYLCVCGMPTPNENHAENIVNAAVDIVHYMNERNKSSRVKWEIRIGVHTGTVVGGVVGIKKYIYDVFGDTINTASRMESNSEPMRINISQSTYDLVKDKFEITPRGSIPVKGKGEMEMFFVEV